MVIPRLWRPYLVLLSCALLLAFGCNSSNPIRIGFLGCISGRVADIGIAGRDGVQLAVDLRNQAGGVNGRKVILLVKDNEYSQETARKEAQALVDQGVSAIIGPMTSAMAMAVVPVVNKAKVICISPSVTTDDLAGKDDYFFRVVATTKVDASLNADYQLKSNLMKKVAVAYDLGNRNYTENWVQNFSSAFAKGGGQVVTKLDFTSGPGVSYSEIARKLLAVKPDGIVIVANAVDSSLLCQQIRKANPDIPITLSEWAAQERLIELGGKAVEGVTMVQIFDRNSKTPRYQEFRRLYRERFRQEPGFTGTYAFEAANLVMDAIARQSGEASLKQTILSGRRFEGLQGPKEMDEFGDVNQIICRISVVKDSKFVVVD